MATCTGCRPSVPRTPVFAPRFSTTGLVHEPGTRCGRILGGLTAALILRDQGWDVDVLERSAVPLQDRGAGIVLHHTTVRYLVERVGKAIGDIGVPASRLRYLGDDGSIAHEQPCAYRFASYFELYQGLLDAFGSETILHSGVS